MHAQVYLLARFRLQYCKNVTKPNRQLSRFSDLTPPDHGSGECAFFNVRSTKVERLWRNPGSLYRRRRKNSS